MLELSENKILSRTVGTRLKNPRLASVSEVKASRKVKRHSNFFEWARLSVTAKEYLMIIFVLEIPLFIF